MWKRQPSFLYIPDYWKSQKMPCVIGKPSKFAACGHAGGTCMTVDENSQKILNLRTVRATENVAIVGKVEI